MDVYAECMKENKIVRKERRKITRGNIKSSISTSFATISFFGFMLFDGTLISLLVLQKTKPMTLNIEMVLWIGIVGWAVAGIYAVSKLLDRFEKK